MHASIHEIQPYLNDIGLWVFDDPDKDLVAEALVAGIPEIIVAVCTRKQIPNFDQGFTVQFSESEFPEYDLVLDHVNAGLPETFKEIDLIMGRRDAEATVAGDGIEEGNTYRLRGTEMTGWLCPALFKYFKSAPGHIFVRCIKGDMRPLERNRAWAERRRQEGRWRASPFKTV